MDEQQLKHDVEKIEQAGDIIIHDPETFKAVSDNIITGKEMRKRILGYFEGMKTSTYNAWKSVCAKEGEMLKPVDDFIKSENRKVSAYPTEQDRIRCEEQRKIDEQRKKDEEKERAKLEARAEKAEASGKTEKAAELRGLADEVCLPPVIVVSDVEKTTRIDTGTISQTRDIKVTVTDVKKKLEAVVAGRLPVGIVTVSESKLKQAVKLAGINHLDGAIIEQVVTAAYRAKAV